VADLKRSAKVKMHMWFFRIFLIGILVGAFGGCIVPKRSVMPATSIECQVFDEGSKKPISGASLLMVYQGPNGERVTEGPFLTGEDGRGHVEVKERTIWQKGTDAYFAGGYLRRIEVRAVGHKMDDWGEGFDYGMLERKAPLKFYLKSQ
jgi:hypothetical protein